MSFLHPAFSFTPPPSVPFLFTPEPPRLRANGEGPTARRYLCKLSDQELRQSAARNMADLMWSTVKEPLDSTLCFDKESLDLAFKYFMSPTLTMRLAGLSQITVSPVLLF